MLKILNNRQQALLKDERTWLAELQVSLAKLGAIEEDHDVLKKSIQQLDDFFLLVVVGEFNAGKSAFINALLGQTVLKEGVTPTTAQVNVLKHGDVTQRQVLGPNLHILTEPLELLQYINIVDTPGTNAVIQEHQAITEEFVPQSDMVLFITSADRPFTESERQFLTRIKEWGKKVVIIINKADIIQSETDLQQVEDFVARNAHSLLETAVEIFPVSARLAQQAKHGEPAKWIDSRFEPLEKYITDSLDEAERLRLKLMNPLGVGGNLLTKYMNITTNRLLLLGKDFDMLDDLDKQLTLFQDDMRRDFKFRLSDLENILYEMEKRGDEFFDETMRLARVPDLLNKDRIQRRFELEVIADTPQALEHKVNELIDWLVNADFNQWQAVMSHLEERKRDHEDRIVGDVGQGFRYDRDHLIDSVGRTAQRVVDEYDVNLESAKIAENAQMAVAQSAFVEVGAIGLGALITAIATTAAIDVTGILAASAVAIFGLFIIPAKRHAAKREMSERVAELRLNLQNSLTTQFDKELNRAIQRINDAVAPYTRFVRAERLKLDETKADLQGLQTTQGRLQAEIVELFH